MPRTRARRLFARIPFSCFYHAEEHGLMIVMPDARPQDFFLTADQVNLLWLRDGLIGEQAAGEAERLASSAQA